MSMLKKMFSPKGLLLLVTLTGFSHIALADDWGGVNARAASGGTQVYIEGNVVAPSKCTILNNGSTLVDFKTVLAPEANGKSITEKIPLNIKCGGTIADNALDLMIIGKAGESSDVLTTDLPYFGLKLGYGYSANSAEIPVRLNERIYLQNGYKTMVLYAHPLWTGTNPQGGYFNTSATLLVVLH